MRKQRTPETGEQRTKRLDQQAGKRTNDAAEADKAIDAMVRRSIELNGP
jgi:hypothetical protein